MGRFSFGHANGVLNICVSQDSLDRLKALCTWKIFRFCSSERKRWFAFSSARYALISRWFMNMMMVWQPRLSEIE